MTAREIIDIYISFFEKRGHKRITNSPLVPENDPTTLFTSSGMQPLIPYLSGEPHPSGNRLVNVQNCFRAVDIEEVGDKRHETFFRMLGNWSLGEYFKSDEIPWLWEFLTKALGLPKEKLFITVFKGGNGVPYDQESYDIWTEILINDGFDPKEKIFAADVTKNWWSRSGIPDNMPVGEIGGPDTEVYFRFEETKHEKNCKDNPVDCECGKFLEIANSVFMQYQKTENGFKDLPQKNVDFGGGVERTLAAVENQPDIFQTSLFSPIIKTIEKETKGNYNEHSTGMQIIADHLTASVFITNDKVKPSNVEQGYILRRLLRKTFDEFYKLNGENIAPIIEKIIEQYKETDPDLVENFEEIKLTILEEERVYKNTMQRAKKIFSERSAKLKGVSKDTKEISAQEAFLFYSTHGLSPTQIRSMGYVFDEQQFSELMKKHQALSRQGAGQKFKGGLADTSEKTIMGHTATHLLHQTLRDVLGNKVHQTGSNITTERVRFDFSYQEKLTDEEIKKVEDSVNKIIEKNLPVSFEMMPLKKAKELDAIGLFDEKYSTNVKVYSIGNYSKEICGGPHVDFTSKLKRFKIIKQENLGRGQRRIYAVVG